MTPDVTIKLDKKYLSGLDNFGVPSSIMQTSELEFQLARSADYKLAQRLVKERFGEDSRAYKTIMNGINPEKAIGSQFFFNNLVERAMTFDDLEKMYQLGEEDLFKKGLYYDTIDLILRTGDAKHKKNQPLLNDLVKQIEERNFKFSEKNPLRISGLELVEDKDEKNEYGVLLKINDNTKIVNDNRFVYGREEIKLWNETVPIFTNTPGLSRVYLYGSGGLISGLDNLAYSDDDGRVVVRRAA